MVAALKRVLLWDRGVTGFPNWFNSLRRDGLVGSLLLSLIVFFIMFAGAGFILHRTGFGRQSHFMGTNADMARFSGIHIRRAAAIPYVASGLVASMAGLFWALRLASVRGDAALGFQLDIIAMVLLGGVIVFGGMGLKLGVLLSVLIVLNLRNGMSLLNITGHIQAGVTGILVIACVLAPNLAELSKSGRKMDAMS